MKNILKCYSHFKLSWLLDLDGTMHWKKKILECYSYIELSWLLNLDATMHLKKNTRVLQLF